MLSHRTSPPDKKVHDRATRLVRPRIPTLKNRGWGTLPEEKTPRPQKPRTGHPRYKHNWRPRTALTCQEGSHLRKVAARGGRVSRMLCWRPIWGIGADWAPPML